MHNPDASEPAILSDADAGWTMILEPLYIFVRRDFVATCKQTFTGTI